MIASPPPSAKPEVRISVRETRALAHAATRMMRGNMYWLVLLSEMGAKIFGMRVDVVEGKGSHPKGPARYDYRRDRIDLFVSYIDQFCEEHDDRKALIAHAICHEAGHASETRSLERGLLFLYGLNVSRRLLSLVRSEFGISLCPEDLDMAMNQWSGVLDYCVDRKLDANGMKDVAAMAVVPQVKLELQKRKSGSYKADLDKFNALTNLPLRIVSYSFGQLDATERAILEEYYRHDDLPDKWRTSVPCSLRLYESSGRFLPNRLKY